jgi:hypothetical protein
MNDIGAFLTAGNGIGDPSLDAEVDAMAANIFGSNNTNAGILGADLAPAGEVLAGGVTSGAGLIRGGARLEFGNWKQAGEWFFPEGTRGPHFHFGSGSGLQSHHLPWQAGNWLRNLSGLMSRGEAGKDIANISMVGSGSAVAAGAAASGGGC